MTQAIDQDLICAVATPAGQGGIGVVRLSGKGARHIAEIICARKLVARRAVYCHFVDRSETLDWEKLKAKVKKDGMRNSNVMAIAPTATISNIAGC